MTDALTPEIKASLIDAGIGRRFHDLTLEDVKYGAGMLDYLKQHGSAIRGSGHSIAFHGVGMTDAITMLARGLHINGVGCKLVPLVRLRGIINDLEFREIVNEIDVLVILNAQDSNRGNPLHNSVAAEVEYVIRKRFDARRATFMQLAVDENVAIGELQDCYWGDEMLDLMSESFDRVTPSALTARAKAAAKQ